MGRGGRRVRPGDPGRRGRALHACALGTVLEASVSGIPAGTACQIWATTISGQHGAAGGWTVTRGDPHGWYPASVPFPAASLDSFDITAHGTVLVTIPLRSRA